MRHLSKIGGTQLARKLSCCVGRSLSKSSQNYGQGSSLFLADITYIQITEWISSFLNDEGGITQQQTEINHEIFVAIVMNQGECSASKTLRR